MASQDKHYIEASDILGVRFDCKKCHASLSLKLWADIKLVKCPAGCDETWFDAPKSALRDSIKSFMNHVQSLPRSDSGEKFRVYLEIAPDRAPCDKNASATAEKGKKSGD
jgi:hypothetical protein